MTCSRIDRSLVRQRGDFPPDPVVVIRLDRWPLTGRSIEAMLTDMLPTTASGRFQFMFLVGVCVLAIAVLVLVIAPALAPVSLGGPAV
jgi:hypothetical protein